MKTPRGGKTCATIPLIWKYSRSAVNIAVSRRCQIFYMAVIQNSPLNLLRSVKSRRYLWRVKYKH
jgi:hypothetical protein